MSQPQTNRSYDVAIVGAGAAGIGCGVVLQELGLAGSQLTIYGGLTKRISE